MSTRQEFVMTLGQDEGLSAIFTEQGSAQTVVGQMWGHLGGRTF